MSISSVHGTLLGTHWLPERACPRCGKRFEPTEEWVYKVGSSYLCSYRCYSAAWKDHEETKRQHALRTALTHRQLLDLFQEFKEGLSPTETAEYLDISKDSVNYYYKRYYLRGCLPESLKRKRRNAL